MCLFQVDCTHSATGEAQTMFPVKRNLLKLMSRGQRPIDELQVQLIESLVIKKPDTSASAAVFIHENYDVTPADIKHKGYDSKDMRYDHCSTRVKCHEKINVL